MPNAESAFLSPVDWADDDLAHAELSQRDLPKEVVRVAIARPESIQLVAEGVKGLCGDGGVPTLAVGQMPQTGGMTRGHREGEGSHKSS